MLDPADLDLDARFLLANERTLLAWVRTALTLLVAGVGALQLVEGRWSLLPGLALLALGGSAAVVGLVRHQQADRALRRGELPTAGRAPAVIAASVAVLAVALVVLGVAGALG